MRIAIIVITTLVLTNVGWADNAVQYTTDPAGESGPSWSHDGSYIAFSSDRSGTMSIWKKPYPDGAAVQLTFQPVGQYRPDWFSGDTDIAYDSIHSFVDIWSIPSKGGTPTNITDDHLYNELEPSVRNDNEWILCYRPADIWAFPIGSAGTAHAVVDWSSHENYPDFAPDGSEFAFSSNYSGNMEIWTVDWGGGNLNQLTNDPAFDFGPAWSPDASYIAFTSERTGNQDIWIIPATGGTPVQITDDPAGDWLPAWSPDGSKIAFASNRNGNADIWVIDVSHINIESASLGEIKATFATDEMIEKQK